MTDKVKTATQDGFDDQGQRPVEIKIDDKTYQLLPGPTAGAVLRALPPVPEDRDLWLERKGDDEKILPETIVEVRHLMVFYTAPRTINPGEVS